MGFAKWTFRIAGIYGLVALLPLYFLEDRIGREIPPPINHPEMFYTMLAVTIAWQVAFIIVSTDPARFRPIMLAAMLEKFVPVTQSVILWQQGRQPEKTLPAVALDLLLGVLFVISYRRTAGLAASSGSTSLPK